MEKHDYDPDCGCWACEAIEAEQKRWQDALWEVYSEYNPEADGSGCESGDPLDLTISELRQTFSRFVDGEADLPLCSTCKHKMTQPAVSCPKCPT